MEGKSGLMHCMTVTTGTPDAGTAEPHTTPCNAEIEALDFTPPCDANGCTDLPSHEADYAVLTTGSLCGCLPPWRLWCHAALARQLHKIDLLNSGVAVGSRCTRCGSIQRGYICQVLRVEPLR